MVGTSVKGGVSTRRKSDVCSELTRLKETANNGTSILDGHGPVKVDKAPDGNKDADLRAQVFLLLPARAEAGDHKPHGLQIQLCTAVDLKIGDVNSAILNVASAPLLEEVGLLRTVLDKALLAGGERG